jgi:hypothetical protein
MGWMWRPHCWQYAKPIGVDVPHRGQLMALPWATARGALGGPGFATGIGVAVGSGGSPAGVAPGSAMICGALIACCGGAMNGDPPAGDAIGPPTPGELGARGETEPGSVEPSAAPQLRQNLIPGGFSALHEAQIAGNSAAGAGVCASALPQLRQNDDPGGLSWPQTEQRI